MQSEKEAGQVLTSENAADFYFSKMGIAAKSEPSAEVEETPSEQVEENNQSEPEEEKEAKPTEERKQNPKLEKRFSDITKQREEARKEAQRERETRENLERELAALRQQSQPPARTPDAKPQPSQFSDAFEYAEALAEWSTEQALINRDKQEAERKARTRHLIQLGALFEIANLDQRDPAELLGILLKTAEIDPNDMKWQIWKN